MSKSADQIRDDLMGSVAETTALGAEKLAEGSERLAQATKKVADKTKGWADDRTGASGRRRLYLGLAVFTVVGLIIAIVTNRRELPSAKRAMSKIGDAASEVVADLVS